MITVTHADVNRQSMLGHIVAGILTRALRDPEIEASMRTLRHSLALVVSGMEVTLEFAGERITVHPGLVGRPKAAMVSDLDTMVRLGNGGSPVRAWLRGRVRLRGNPLRLLPLLPILSLGDGARGV